MGLPMCHNLVASSQQSFDRERILAFDKQLPPAASLPQNVQIFESMEELITSAEGKIDVVLTALPNDAAVKDVILDILRVKSKLNGDKRSNTLFIDVSTISPSTTKELNSIMSSNGGGCTMVDAPMSGGVKGAEKGSLTFMVGSKDDQTFETAKTVLMKMGRKVIRCGDVGMGGAAKLCNNLALGVQMIGICEAVLLGEEFGIDPVVLASVMNSSTAKCWSSEINNPHPDVAALAGSPASKQYHGGFSVELMLKDMRLGVGISKASNVSLPLSSKARKLYSLAKSHGHEKQDFGVLFEFLKGQKGL